MRSAVSVLKPRNPVCFCRRAFDQGPDVCSARWSRSPRLGDSAFEGFVMLLMKDYDLDIFRTSQSFTVLPLTTARCFPSGVSWAVIRAKLLKFDGIFLVIPLVVFPRLGHDASRTLNETLSVFPNDVLCRKAVLFVSDGWRYCRSNR